MAAERISFDANVAFYSIDRRFPEKHSTARAIFSELSTETTVVVLQSMGELCNAISKRLPHLLDDAEAFAEEMMTTFSVQVAQPGDITEALSAHRQHGLQFGDAMLWAAARRADCKLLLSEDLQDGRRLGGVTFRNPFKMSIKELKKLLV